MFICDFDVNISDQNAIEFIADRNIISPSKSSKQRTETDKIRILKITFLKMIMKNPQRNLHIDPYDASEDMLDQLDMEENYSEQW